MDNKVTLKINNKKYYNVEYLRFKELIDNNSVLRKYDIVIQFDNTKWIQIFREKGFTSVAYNQNGNVYQYYKLAESENVSKLLNQYFLQGKVEIRQKADKVTSNKNQDNILKWFGFGILLVSLLLMFIKNTHSLDFINFKFLLMLFSIRIIITTFNGIKNKEYCVRNDILFFGGIMLFICSFFLLVFR